MLGPKNVLHFWTSGSHNSLSTWGHILLQLYYFLSWLLNLRLCESSLGNMVRFWWILHCRQSWEERSKSQLWLEMLLLRYWNTTKLILVKFCPSISFLSLRGWCVMRSDCPYNLVKVRVERENTLEMERKCGPAWSMIFLQLVGIGSQVKLLRHLCKW